MFCYNKLMISKFINNYREQKNDALAGDSGLRVKQKAPLGRRKLMKASAAIRRPFIRGYVDSHVVNEPTKTNYIDKKEATETPLAETTKPQNIQRDPVFRRSIDH